MMSVTNSRKRPLLIRSCIVGNARGSQCTYIPSPYPSPQGEGTSGNPTARGGGIEKHNKIWIAKGNVKVEKDRRKGSRHFWLSMFAEKGQKPVDTQ